MEEFKVGRSRSPIIVNSNCKTCRPCGLLLNVKRKDIDIELGSISRSIHLESISHTRCINPKVRDRIVSDIDINTTFIDSQLLSDCPIYEYSEI